LFGLDHGAVQIYRDYPKIPIRQVKRIADGVLDPINHNLAAAPQDPQGDLALVRERNFGEEG
jgi:hypothetical protein